MAIRIEELINSRTGLIAAAFLARAIPPWLGYSLAGVVADRIAARRGSGIVKAVRSNQWVLAGQPGLQEKDTQATLDQFARAVFQNSARSIYDLYHYILDPKTAGRLFRLDPSFEALFARPEFDRRGLVIAGLHMSGFDLALQWICGMNWIHPLVLTLPTSEGGRELEFEIRQKTGMNLVPATVIGLRQALRHLKQGGMVVTGMDRPVTECKPQPLFFGRPAALPVHHIYLALKAQTPVTVVATRLGEDGKYHLFASPPIEMQGGPGDEDALQCNAEKVLAVAEEFIRQAPQQWSISLPVWPETLENF